MFYLSENDGRYEDRESVVVEISYSREELEEKAKIFNQKILELQEFIDTEVRRYFEIRKLRFELALKENNISNAEYSAFRKKWNEENPVPDNMEHCFYFDYDSQLVIRNVNDLYYDVREMEKAFAELL